MGIILSLCCKKKNAEPSYKKVEEQSVPDLEGGVVDEDGEEWDDFNARPSHPSSHSRGRPPPPQPSAHPIYTAAEPEPEPEPDPFAGFDMAPKIGKTKRHNAREANVFAKPAVPSSSMFSMDNDAQLDGAGEGGGWGDADLGDDLGVNERRRVAEERREARKKEREAAGSSGRETKRPLKVAATKVSSE